MSKNSFSVSCMGSRERYYLPVALNSLSSLGRLYTDIYVPRCISDAAKNIPKRFSGLKALLSRNNPELPISKVKQWPFLGVDFRLHVRSAATRVDRQNTLLEFGRKYSDNVARQLSKNENLVGFTGQALSSLRKCRDIGGVAVLNQVDPGFFEWDKISKEEHIYRDWLPKKSNVEAWSFEFEKHVLNEIRTANFVVVNSEYSRQCIERWSGVDNIRVIGIPCTFPVILRTEYNYSAPLKLLFLGGVSVRKGIHYLIPAVDALVQQGIEIDLTIVGELQVDIAQMKKFKGWRYLGTLSSSDIIKCLDDHDVLVFPSLSEGYGMVQTEALARGLPVITTEYCAKVVRDRIDGIVLKEVSVDTIIDAILEYVDDRTLLKKHGESAFNSFDSFCFSGYKNKIKDVFVGDVL
jgi:glycosyltransferase involved in cell wall biosynthesis